MRFERAGGTGATHGALGQGSRSEAHSMLIPSSHLPICESIKYSPHSLVSLRVLADDKSAAYIGPALRYTGPRLASPRTILPLRPAEAGSFASTKLLSARSGAGRPALEWIQVSNRRPHYYRTDANCIGAE